MLKPKKIVFCKNRSAFSVFFKTVLSTPVIRRWTPVMIRSILIHLFIFFFHFHTTHKISKWKIIEKTHLLTYENSLICWVVRKLPSSIDITWEIRRSDILAQPEGSVLVVNHQSELDLLGNYICFYLFFLLLKCW